MKSKFKNEKDYKLFVIIRINELKSIFQVFDLMHSHLNKTDIPKNFKNRNEMLFSQTNLYIIGLSYLYSLFNKSGIDIRKLDCNSIDKAGNIMLRKIDDLWNKVEKPITNIRHNIGFHGGGLPQLKNAIKAGETINSSELIPEINSLVGMLDELSIHLQKDIGITVT